MREGNESESFDRGRGRDRMRPPTNHPTKIITRQARITPVSCNFALSALHLSLNAASQGINDRLGIVCVGISMRTNS
jgi:hypothetical protein